MNTAQVKKRIANILLEGFTDEYFAFKLKYSASFKVYVEFDVAVGNNKWVESRYLSTNRPNEIYRQLYKIKAVSNILVKIC